ncbi:DNA internalization-related competence protein ComEC/Rec2 [Pantoea sp. Bo_7]|uniref:DNA internalization-related competence protein ComEC/Rec2 n=1 Tax=unclassified Pantoea TaxID=2630326 RepID=UPI001231D21E|nr:MULTISPECIES: DNA internalization-related competence protein ComEC/Rec2 [unclassified Pantoea]KAA6048107.1 DNA internalization-related competence protein ComEC/Rec2 [Pantoea sp. Bo_7]KAA6093352.1 DNA internalization-related competence protein ComEC/Rec2 [Pantoea sp. Bo_10]
MHITWTTGAGIAILATLPLLLLPQIPSGTTLAVLTLIAIFLLHRSHKAAVLAGITLLVACWAQGEARSLLNAMELLTRRPVDAMVSVSAIDTRQNLLLVRLIRVDGRLQFPPLFVQISNVSNTENWCAGQRWHMRLRLRAVHGRLNEGGYDLQRVRVANHMPLQGRIVHQQQMSERCSLRATLVARYQAALAELKQPAILQALAFGDRSQMLAPLRQLLRDTGTAHLMAISGMHIALAATGGWLLARAIQFALPARYISWRFPLIVSWLTAALYCWIAGSHAPAQRAMLALTLWSAIRAAGWQLSAWQIWLLCVGTLLLFDPLAVLSESFWLSALAVAMLIIWFSWFALPYPYRTQRRWLPLQLLHLQLGMMILMAPLQIFLFQGISLTALLANLLAVPVISFITVPLLLLALLVPLQQAAQPLWWLADRSVDYLVQALQWLPAGWLSLHQTLPAVIVIWGGLLLWRSGLIARTSARFASLLLALLLGRTDAQQSDWQIDFLDIGHGLAVAITQGREVVLYDTGPAWQQGDAGERTILPWLNYTGRTLQGVILSHRHLDHRGGLNALLRARPALAIRSALGEPGHLPCVRGQQWQWGRLRFTALWPPALPVAGHNNDSCVVRVDDGQVSLLLTGDLEQAGERKLAALEKGQLQATLLQVPHHGSRTSSTPLFLRHIAGEAAVASVARYNAWRMPARAVVKRYREQGYRWADTARSGQVRIRISQGRWQMQGLREQIKPRWYHQWFGVKDDSR